MRRCAEDVRAEFPRGSVRELAPIDAVLAAATQLENNAASGLAPRIAALLTSAPAKKRSVMHAVNALAAFAVAIEGATRGDPEVDEEFDRARDFSAMSASRVERPPTVADMIARVEGVTDPHDLPPLVDIVVDHSMRKVAPVIFERLGEEGAPALVRKLHQMYTPRLELFMDLCVSLLASPRALTRRWAAYGLSIGMRAADVQPLVQALSDENSSVRSEAAIALRAAVIWYPERRTTIGESARAALEAHPEDRSVGELVRATS